MTSRRDLLEGAAVADATASLIGLGHRRAGAQAARSQIDGVLRQGVDARDAAYPAEMFVAAAAHYIAIDFLNVTQTGGDLMPMAKQCRDAVAWVYKNAASFGGDPNRIYLSGHSSGAHLAGVVLVTDWEKDYGLPKDVI